MASVIPVRVSNGNPFAAPIYTGGGYAPAPRSGFQFDMDRDKSNDTATMLAILQFLSNQNTTAAQRDALRDSLGLQQRELDARTGQFRDELAAMREQNKEMRLLTEKQMDAAESRFSRTQDLSEARSKAEIEAVKAQIEAQKNTQNAGLGDRLMSLFSQLAPAQANQASAQVSAEKEARMVESDIAMSEAAAKATAGIGTFMTDLRDAVTQEVDSYSPWWSDAPRKKAEAMADAVRSRLTAIGDPKLRAAAARSLQTQVKDAIGEIEKADWKSYMTTRGSETAHRSNYASPLYGVLSELEGASATAAGEREKLGILRQAQQAQTNIANQQGQMAGKLWQAATSTQPAAEAFGSIPLPTYDASWPSAQPTSRPASDAAIRDPAGSGGPLDPMRQAIEQYTGSDDPFAPFMSGYRGN